MPDYQTFDLIKKLELSERRRAQLRRRLLKRSSTEEGFGWSLADLMTLLLIFFVLFYSQAVARMGDPAEKKDDRNGLSVKAFFTWTEPRPAVDRRHLADLQHQIDGELAQDQKEDLRVEQKSEGLVFTLGERISFNNGEADLLPEAEVALGRIAEIINAKMKYNVVVAGHTDDRPINTVRFPSNLELSTARAVTVAQSLINSGVAAGRVSVRGYSSHRPLYGNDTPDHRQANRRVEILLVKKR